MNTTRRYAIASLAVMAASLKQLTAKAQTQVIHNGTQVVSTDDVVIQQSAGGQQYVWNDNTQAWQAISNDAQVVSTGTVTIGQSAAGNQVDYAGNPLTQVCTPGEYKAIDGGLRFCRADGCMWMEFFCDTRKQKKCCGK